MKQKTALLLLALGLFGSFFALIPAVTVSAEPVPISCLSDPDGEQCKMCQENPSSPSESCVKVDCETNPDGPGCNQEETCEGPDCCGNVETSIIKGDVCNESGEGGVIFGLLKGVLTIMTAGIGIAAVGGIAYGALLYTTAENKPDQTKKAISIITNVVIGLVAYALMAVLLNFLIPGGIIG